MTKLVPGAKTVPFQVPGATDSRYFRNKFGSIAYGLSPFLVDGDISELATMIHGRNERISIDNLLFGAKFLFEVVRDFDLPINS